MAHHLCLDVVAKRLVCRRHGYITVRVLRIACTGTCTTPSCTVALAGGGALLRRQHVTFAPEEPQPTQHCCFCLVHHVIAVVVRVVVHGIYVAFAYFLQGGTHTQT